MKKSGFFWIGFADLMTSLFFIMLVLYVVSFALYKKQISKIDEITCVLENSNEELTDLVIELENTKDLLLIKAEKARILEDIEKNLEPLIKNSSLFRYEEKYKRFTLAFDVKFKDGKSNINKWDLENFEITSEKIKEVGIQLKNTINELADKKKNNPEMKNVSYLLIISGYASKLLKADEGYDYKLSYDRSYNLWRYWKRLSVDFEATKYKGLIDLQISGNGWGGVGRFKRDPKNYFKNETKNQRFIIQIVPKIGKTD